VTGLNRTFKSRFAGRIADFVQQKRILGFPYDGSEAILEKFDRFCLARFPNETALTKDLCLAWAVRRETEGNNGFRNRVSPVREFAKFLIRTGETAYIVPPEFTRRGHRPLPYIYSEEEVAALLRVFDEMKPRKGFPVRHFVIPAIFRLLYCCGLRPAEARKLKVHDVDLNIGKIYIRESKGHKDRIVMLGSENVEYFRAYNENVSRKLPGREWFFPNSSDELYTKVWLDKTFRTARANAGITGESTNPPRPYDLRHTFATHRLYLWMKEGRNLDSMLPYLSTYMGHAQLSDTYYYIHLVPGQLKAMSGLDFSKYESLLPEVDDDE
jgi:integrase